MAISSLSEQAHSSTTTSSITLPASISAGDLLIISHSAGNGSGTPAAVTPSGFTLAGTYTSSFGRQSLHWKLALGTESSASVSILSGTSYQRGLAVQFRANEAITAVTAGSPVGQITDSNPTSKNITASASSSPLVVIACWTDSPSFNAISPRTQSPAMTEISDVVNQYMGWLFYASSPSDQSFDMDDEGQDNGLNGVYLELTGSAYSPNGKFFSVF